jgi:hypothetical protein
MQWSCSKLQPELTMLSMSAFCPSKAVYQQLKMATAENILVPIHGKFHTHPQRRVGGGGGMNVEITS